MDLFAVGALEDSDWILLMDGNDKSPENPSVYYIDHAPEENEEMECLGSLEDVLKSMCAD